MTNEQAINIAMDAVDEAVRNGRPLLYKIPDEKEIVMLEGTVSMIESDDEIMSDYSEPIRLHTIGFVKVFGEEAMTIAYIAFELIREKDGRKGGFMHKFCYEYPNGEKVFFRVKNDVEAIIVYLPCED